MPAYPASHIGPPAKTLNGGKYDVVVVGGTPSGAMAAIAAARRGRTAVVLERTSHVGGLLANGLGATDISTRELAGGLFREFTNRVEDYYVRTYGARSEQVTVCSKGYHFEPKIAEKILSEMLGECPGITVLTRRQFDAQPDRVVRQGRKISAVKVRNLATGEDETYTGSAFVDGTYEADLAAAAGVPFSTRREGRTEYHEPMAGRVFQKWGSPEIGEGSTFEGDDTIQAYNFRLCLTDRPENQNPILQPPGYDRNEYVSLIDDLTLDRAPGRFVDEIEWDGIGRITNIVYLPNGKTDANNQHLAYLSTDLPEENYAWPRADWVWRDNFQTRLRNYTLGLFWFFQNDPEVPESFQTNARRYGLAADEYTDNGNFPRQVYVREGRRIVGERIFLAHDAIPESTEGRPPIHADSITASHYPVDSHAIHKREPGRDHLDGFISVRTQPYTVPYGIMVPKTVDNLWVPVAVSASHMGFGTLRMEPCWMALGEAAGTAVNLALRHDVAARLVPIDQLQSDLAAAGVFLIYHRGVTPDEPALPVIQYLGVRGILPEWDLRLDDPVTGEEQMRWAAMLGVDKPLAAGQSRRQVLLNLWQEFCG